MTIVVVHNQAGEVATETKLESIQMPEVWNNAFFQFKGLDGVVKFMVPVARVAALHFSDNTITLVK